MKNENKITSSKEVNKKYDPLLHLKSSTLETLSMVNEMIRMREEGLFLNNETEEEWEDRKIPF